MTIQRVIQYIKRHRLIVPGDLVVVGVSGGPDSVALLHLLLQLRDSMELGLHAAHLHHGLREEADLDQGLVETLCQDWGVPLALQRVDVSRMAQSRGMSVEEAGREARYRFLGDICQELGGQRIATAHHRGDQAETVLLHLIQGTGAWGLQGILPRRNLIIRPLLDLTKADIMAYIDVNSLPCRIDCSNFDNNYLRNRIRWELMPLLEQRFNPAMEDALCRLAEVMREENFYWGRQVNTALENVSRDEKNRPLAISVDSIRQMPLAMKRRFLHQLLRQTGSGRVTWDDVDRVIDIMSRPGSDRRVPVSGGLWVRNSYGIMEFGARETEGGFCYPLAIPGTTEIKEVGLTVTTRILSQDQEAMPGTELFDWEALKKPLFVRSRRPGDSFRPQGLGGSKKLKKYLIDEKVPAAERDRIGILTAEDQIYWVIGYRRDERGRVTLHTRNFLEVTTSNVDK